MNRLIAALLMALLLALTLGQAAHASEVTSVPSLDLDRYAGKWLEIARFPNRFQAMCIGNVSADYRRRDDGEIDVINRCKNTDGKLEQAIGRGRVVDAVSRARLKVRFAPAWLAWLPQGWGDYWILDLAPDYSLAAVGDPSRQYLWILARQPVLPAGAYDALLARLAAQGFDVAKLVITKQEPEPGK